MALTGVIRSGFVQLRVLDMEASLKHYNEYVGLDIVETGDDGRVYLKTPGEFDHHSIILRPAEEAGMDVLGFKVDTEESLQGFKEKLEAYGVATEEIAPGEQPGVGRRVRFVLPTGHTIDLYADMEVSIDGPMTTNPDLWHEPPRGMKPTRFDHCLLYGADIDGSESVLVDVLGFRRTEYLHADNPEKTVIALFLSCSARAHDIAFVRNEENNKFHHASFNVPDWNAIGHAADLMSRYDIPVDIGPTRHGITQGQTIYFWDPSGNRNEVFAGGYDCYPDTPVRIWQESQGGKAIFYYEKKINDSFMAVYT